MTHDDEHDHDYDEHEHHHHHHHGSTRSWLTGFVIGGLAGLAVSLLYAPQAGRDTRELVRYKATQLRQAAEQTAQETKERVDQMTDEAKDQVRTMRQRSMDYVDETKDRVKNVANAVTQAAKESWEAEPTNSSTTSTTRS
jgi:gas vesicle protein